MLYAHQQKLINDDPKRTLIAHGTGTGKTRTALSLARGGTLVIAPKQQKEDRTWEKEAEASGLSLPLNVVSKEQFRKEHARMSHYDTVIVEEAHTALGIQPNVRQRNKKPIPKASKIFEALHAYLQRTRPKRIYLVTATPTRTPMCVFAAGAVLGKWPLDMKHFYAFRDIYYVKLPMAGREAYKPKSDKEIKKRLGRTVQSIGYTARIEDLFDVPQQTYITERLPLTAEEKEAIDELPIAYPDPLALIGKTHQAEQGVNKTERIRDLALEFERIAVFARYKDQIARIREKLENDGLRVLTLTGDTKDRDTVIQEANDGDPCVFICQSQVGAGFELPHFPCAVFASLDWSYVNFAQNCGRILRANNLGAKIYITLLSGEIDEAVNDALHNKSDFQSAIYARDRLSENSAHLAQRA